MRRGEVYWADLTPRSGAEPAGRRPVIVVSHDGFNETRAWRPVSSSTRTQGRGGLEVRVSDTGPMGQTLARVPPRY